MRNLNLIKFGRMLGSTRRGKQSLLISAIVLGGIIAGCQQGDAGLFINDISDYYQEEALNGGHDASSPTPAEETPVEGFAGEDSVWHQSDDRDTDLDAHRQDNKLTYGTELNRSFETNETSP